MRRNHKISHFLNWNKSQEQREDPYRKKFELFNKFFQNNLYKIKFYFYDTLNGDDQI